MKSPPKSPKLTDTLLKLLRQRWRHLPCSHYQKVSRHVLAIEGPAFAWVPVWPGQCATYTTANCSTDNDSTDQRYYDTKDNGRPAKWQPVSVFFITASSRWGWLRGFRCMFRFRRDVVDVGGVVLIIWRIVLIVGRRALVVWRVVVGVGRLLYG